jgi:DNA-binding SARP family transcriptional activator
VEYNVPLIWMLGPLHIGDPGASLTPTRRKERELLALLLVRVGTVVSSAEIIDSLWSTTPPASARANVHSYVYDLRRLLGRATGDGVLLEHVRNGYRLTVPADGCDAAVFERCASTGRQALADGETASAAQHLARALALWRGPVLDGMDRPDWLAPVAARLEETHLAAFEDHVQARLALGWLGGLTAELADATTRYPLRERLWGHLMVALYRAGRKAEALNVYAKLQDVLDHELGVRPGPVVRKLYHRIRTAS